MAGVLLPGDKHRDTALRGVGKDAALLWKDALHECASYGGGAGRDGVLDKIMVGDAANLYTPPVNLKRCAPLLVDAGLWHDVTSIDECGPCLEHGGDRLAAGHWMIHEWWEFLLLAAGQTDHLTRWRERRRKALNNDGPLRAAIKARDRQLCRYCGIVTKDSSGADKKSGDVLNLDHVDPWLGLDRDGNHKAGNTRSNVVCACRDCNVRKAENLPGAAGMSLWLPGTTATDIEAGIAFLEPDQTRSSLKPIPARSDPAASGQDPAGTTPDPTADPAYPHARSRVGTLPDPDPFRPDPAGSRPALPSLALVPPTTNGGGAA